MTGRVRIANDTLNPMQTVVTDAETGQRIRGGRSIDLHIGTEGVVTAEIEVLAEIDVVAEATITRLRLNGETGRYEPIEDEA